MTEQEKQELKNKAITDLFNSGELQKKITYICNQHRIPPYSQIHDDILQVVMENLCKYNTDKFIQAYKENPKRILALSVTLALRKGVYKDTRTSKYWSHSIAQQILHQSTLNTLEHISSTIEDDTNEYNLPQISINDIYEEPEEHQMWDCIEQQLTVEENELLQQHLQPDFKPKKQVKKMLPEFYIKLKQIIIQYKLNKEYE